VTRGGNPGHDEGSGSPAATIVASPLC